jgi:hypothetical protein
LPLLCVKHTIIMAYITLSAANAAEFVGKNVNVRSPLSSGAGTIYALVTPGVLPQKVISSLFSSKSVTDVKGVGAYPNGSYVGQFAIDGVASDILRVGDKVYAKVKLEVPVQIGLVKYESLWFWIETLKADNGLRATDPQGYNTDVFCNGDAVSLRQTASSTSPALTKYYQAQKIGYSDGKTVRGVPYTTSKGSGSDWYKIKREDGSFGFMAKPFVSFAKPANTKPRAIKNADGSTTLIPESSILGFDTENVFKYLLWALGAILIGFGVYLFTKKRPTNESTKKTGARNTETKKPESQRRNSR